MFSHYNAKDTLLMFFELLQDNIFEYHRPINFGYTTNSG
jgi:hypothetical protein